MSWQVLPEGPEILDPFHESREHLLELSLTTRTDDSGRFEFTTDLSGAVERTVVWVTHGRHSAAQRVLETTAESREPLRFELEAAEPFTAVVRDSAGNLLTGAEVRQLVRFPLDEDVDVKPETSLALAAFTRTRITDSEGRVELAPHPFPQIVAARHGDRCSPPWLGEQPAHVELIVGEVFTARGRLTHAEPDLDLTHSRVIAYAHHTADFRPIGRARVAADGAWGPVALPLTGGTPLEFRLVGDGIVHKRVEIEPPPSGGELVIDFVAEAAYTLPVRVVGPKDEPVVGAIAQVLWQSGADWHTAQGRTQADGIAQAKGCASGHLWVRVHREGYSKETVELGPTTKAPEEPIVVRLAAAGKLTGRVLSGGEPLKEFSVTVWGGDLTDRNSFGFEGREDGTFEIDQAPLGKVHVLASTKRLPASEPVSVVVEPGEEPPFVEIELAEPIVGRGRIVDLLSGEGVPSAKIQLYSTWGRDNVTAWGPPRPVAADGPFEIAGFTRSSNVFIVSAPGYADRYDIVDGTGRSELDLGAIALTPTQELLVRGIAPEGTDFSSWKVTGSLGTWRSDAVALDERGEARFEGVPPGYVNLRVSGLAAGLDVVQELRPGARWVVDVELPAPDTEGLQVQLVVADDVAERPESILVQSMTRAPSGATRTVYVSGSWDTPCSVPAPFSAEVFLRALDARTFEVLGAARVYDPEDHTAPVELEVGAPLRTLRVVDGAGEPLPATAVYLVSPDGDWALHVREVADERGLVRMRLSPLPRMLAYFFHPMAGCAIEVPVDIPEDPAEVIELVLDVSATVKLTFLDGTMPLQGVVARGATRPGGALSLTSPPTDPNGVCTLGPTRPGTYWVRPDAPGVWPVDHEVELRDDPLAVTLQARRLGSLDVEVRTPGGAPLPGVVVELVSEELGTSVATWVADGRVQTSSPTLASGADGRLRVVGLPRGSYRWRATFADGTAASGLTTVPPRATERLTIEGRSGS